MMREQDKDERIYIPIINKEACVTYYAIYHKNDNNVYDVLQTQIPFTDWKKA